MTFTEIKTSLAKAGKPVAEAQLYRYFRACKIESIGAKQIPRRYPDDSVARILDYLQLPAGNGAVASDSCALPNGTLTIKHDLPAHATAAAMLNDPKLKATIRTGKTILERTKLIPMPALRAARKAPRKGAGK